MLNKVWLNVVVAVLVLVFVSLFIAPQASAGEFVFYDYSTGRGLIGTTSKAYDDLNVIMCSASDDLMERTVIKAIFALELPGSYSNEGSDSAVYEAGSNVLYRTFDSWREAMVFVGAMIKKFHVKDLINVGVDTEAGDTPTAIRPEPEGKKWPL